MEKSYSFVSANNHAMSFTDHIIQYFASQPENKNITFTHAYPGIVRTPVYNNFPFWARIPLNLLTLSLGVTAEDCAKLMIYGMLGTEKGYRYIDNKGETVINKRPIQEDMITKTWEHTSRIISSS
ncbi:unnamed protein product [Rotaria sp. Silwood2]|nr:unnamed protein product [Rotaria sp. Silwood2]CAF4784514.1 unnamed protein product [Rotaria sp. Silwood2]